MVKTVQNQLKIDEYSLKDFFDDNCFFCEIVSVWENAFVGDFVVVGEIGFLVKKGFWVKTFLLVKLVIGYFLNIFFVFVLLVKAVFVVKPGNW